MSVECYDNRESHKTYGPPVWPTFERLEGLLQSWQREYPDVMQLYVPGSSLQGRPVYVARLTDPTTPEYEKEHALITALHSGVERSGTTTVFCIMEWLLSNDPLAREILRRQVVVCIPVSNPDGYVTGKHGAVYSDWTFEGPAHPDKVPEAVAVQEIMDQYQPEVHADIHGLSMDFERYIMFESSGSAYSNFSLRPYHRDIIRQMDEAALAEGYPSDQVESDAERMFWGPKLDSIKEKLWGGRPDVYAATYCYNRYHTLVSASEVCWERSGLLRHRRLLQIGNEIWPGEYYPGYPTRVIVPNTHNMVVAYGQTAAQRRLSRVELWNKQRQITFGMIDPNVDGKMLCVCATSPSATARWLQDKTVKEFVAQLRDCPGINVDFIEDFTEGWPAGQNYPEAHLALRVGGANPKETLPIEHGLSLRLRIPSDKARLVDIRVNGQPISPSETDGYITWIARGITHVQVNIPPQRVKTEDLFVVTCAYDSNVVRARWRKWWNLG